MIIAKPISARDEQQSSQTLSVIGDAVPTTMAESTLSPRLTSTGITPSTPTPSSAIPPQSTATTTTYVHDWSKLSMMDSGNTASGASDSSTTTAPSSSRQSLNTAAIVGLSAGIAVALVVLLSVCCLAWRLRRQHSPRRLLPAFVSDKFRRRRRGSSDSLTSFDTRTEDGLNQFRGKVQDQALAENEQQPLYPGRQQPLMRKPVPLANLSCMKCSSPLARPSSPALRYEVVKSNIPPRDSTETTQSAIPFGKPHLSPYSVSAQSDVRSQSSSALPKLITTMYTQPIQSRSASDLGKQHQYRRLSPIPDSPSLPNPAIATAVSPEHNSPYELVSPLANLLPVTPLELPTISPISIKASFNRGISPVALKAATSLSTYLDSKPLPRSPPGPPAPPPPFSPPLPPTQIRKEYAETGLRGARSDSTISSRFARSSHETRHPKASSSQEFLPSGMIPHQRGPPAASSYIHGRAQSHIHISSLVRSTPVIAPLPSPKPVLKLDTSRNSKVAFLQPRVHASMPTTKSTPTPTPVSAARSAPATFPGHYLSTFAASPYSAMTAPEIMLNSSSRMARPISVTATAASGSPALSISSDNSEEGDEAPPTPRLSPAPAAYLSHQEPITASSIINDYAEPLSPPLLTFDTKDLSSTRSGHLNHINVMRSPSISVPIVFRFSTQRKSSMRPPVPHLPK